ncbi:NAD(P)-dependent alcohol dehydrogenase [Thiotrichales bacterium 19S9-12]|nr:NAD(P)-dependent alcohol dehydrogenase [Thiotrichales bacterium 19S9-11]MCF6812598.1 NAD(P)-dependent alcohol dehydrogenase [Thiotrichales bacterium 19S9-12]
MSAVNAYGAKSEKGAIESLLIDRRKATESDVEIKIHYCGICHSDIHQVNNDWGGSFYPIVPGHEIVGEVIKTGSNVTKFQVGDIVGVGCMVDSCGHCGSCKDNLEQYCDNGFVATYNSEDKTFGGVTYGGYSEKIVVDEKFVLSVPTNIELKGVAPLLCAGITTWSPLVEWNIKAGDRIGVIGLGGLGHMGVKFAKALGATVVMITTSESKGADAKKLGADEVLLSTDTDQMTQQKESFDFLLNTVPVKHDLNPYLALLKRDKTMVIVGAVEPFGDNQIHGVNLIFKRRRIAGSLIGGIKETQEMLDFCGEHQIVSDIELIKPDEINTAYERMIKSDVKYRFVIDFVNQ